MICQHFYWPEIRDAVCMEVTNCDTSQCTKQFKKYGKLMVKLAVEIPWFNLCVDIIGSYFIRKIYKKENLDLTSVNMIDPVTGWFEIAQYEDKIAISIMNLVEATWLSRFPIPI